MVVHVEGHYLRIFLCLFFSVFVGIHKFLHIKVFDFRLLHFHRLLHNFLFDNFMHGNGGSFCASHRFSDFWHLFLPGKVPTFARSIIGHIESHCNRSSSNWLDGCDKLPHWHHICLRLYVVHIHFLDR